MNKFLKIPLISLVGLFLVSCSNVQQENPLVNALLENGIDISLDSYSLNKEQAICIVKNVGNL